MIKKPDVVDKFEDSISDDIIVAWLKNLSPYTNNLIVKFKKKDLETLLFCDNGYKLYLMELKSNPSTLIDSRIKKLLNLFFNCKVEFINHFNDFENEIHCAQIKFSEMQSEGQSFNDSIDNFTNDAVARLNLNSFRKFIEGIFNPLINPIIYLLEYQKGFNPAFTNVKSRYFTQKYYRNSANRKCTIEQDFPILFYNFDIGLRNSEAHADFKVDCRNNKYIIKTGTRSNPVERNVSFSEFHKIINMTEHICRQIIIATQLFMAEYQDEFPESRTELSFEQLIDNFAKISYIYGFRFKKYEINNDKLIFYFESSEKIKCKNPHIYLHNFAIVFLKIVNKCQSKILKVQLYLDELHFSDLNILDMKKYVNNETKEEFKSFVKKSMALHKSTGTSS